MPTDLCYVGTVEHLSISSSWLVVNGDVTPLNGRKPNGKKYRPRKKRGKPISEEGRQLQQHAIEMARARRRGGADAGWGG